MRAAQSTGRRIQSSSLRVPGRRPAAVRAQGRVQGPTRPFLQARFRPDSSREHEVQRIFGTQPATLPQFTQASLQPQPPICLPVDSYPEQARPWPCDAPPVASLRQPTASFPLVVQAASGHQSHSRHEWGWAASTLVGQLLPASEGALLFRGLPLAGPREFKEFVEGLQWPRVTYEPVVSKRQQAEGRCTHITSFPGNLVLHNHHEMSYSPRSPCVVTFYCVTPAIRGGESLLTKNRDLTASLPSESVARLQSNGTVTYRRQYGDAAVMAAETPPVPGRVPRWGDSWQESTGTDDRMVAEMFWHDAMGFNVSWDAEGTMHLSWTTPAFIRDAVSGENVWFNTVDLSSHVPQVSYAQGCPIQDLRWQLAYGLRLDAGDWLVLDNLRVQHGRMPYEGSERQMMVVMA